MSQSQQLADEIVRTMTGPMWHGPALTDVLGGLTAEEAAMRPIPSAHTIWELVLHIGTWVDVARSRVGGRSRKEVPPEEDWPPMPVSNDSEWRAALRRLEEQHRALARELMTLPDERLDEKVRGHDYTTWTLLHGVVEHGTYHAGQIALLRKLVVANR